MIWLSYSSNFAIIRNVLWNRLPVKALTMKPLIPIIEIMPSPFIIKYAERVSRTSRNKVL